MTTITTRPKDEEFQMPSLRLDGRVALVTGGNRGLGLGIALALAHQGADVALAARTPSELDQATTLVRRFGRTANMFPCDVSNVEAVRAMVAQAAVACGRIDILVNAAGMNIRRPIDSFTEEDWDRLMGVNLKGAFFAAQAVAPIMRRQGGGRIINVGSVTFERAVPNVCLYGISKGGMRHMTHSLALELAKDNITVNALAPGRFWTTMTDGVFSDPEKHAGAVQVIPLGRPGVPADLAGAAVLLASDAGAYITGQTITIDGGWTINSGVRA
jgi:NAD(P)-dependent dehydrogenase (short-subunit alcohol dehydrogenase family)